MAISFLCFSVFAIGQEQITNNDRYSTNLTFRFRVKINAELDFTVQFVFHSHNVTHLQASRKPNQNFNKPENICRRSHFLWLGDNS